MAEHLPATIAQGTQAPRATLTSVPTDIPPTPTPDINNLSIDQAARAILKGELLYPSEWPDERLHDLALEIADYLNENVVADEAYVEMHFIEVGDIRVGWDPVAKRWHSDHNTPAESLDFIGDSFPELIVPGYTNAEGKEVIVDPETGEERVLEQFNLPGLGEISISALSAMDQMELTNYAVDLMFDADGTDGFSDNEVFRGDFESGRNHSYALPVILSEPAQEIRPITNQFVRSINDPIYHAMTNGGSAPISIPEVPRHFRDVPTNGVLLPIFDQDSDQIIIWLRIQQGIMMPRNHTFPFSSGQNPTWAYSWNGDARIFGNQPNHSFAILFPKKTNTGFYLNPGPGFLEDGIGIGDTEDVLRILNVKSIEELIEELAGLRLLTLYPGIELHLE